MDVTARCRDAGTELLVDACVDVLLAAAAVVLLVVVLLVVVLLAAALWAIAGTVVPVVATAVEVWVDA